ncbi:MAG TPA: dipeptide ABC transporter ATP-binding protein [Burkholderiaceae bacterium]|nr:dipeptide ABC transporter ATP-binding protein [Burkholderiaceae bacterium]
MNALLEAVDLAKHFPVRTGLFGRAGAWVRAVDGVSMLLHPAETFAIVGESGCGKSTLARLLVRLVAPTRGTLHLEGVDLASLPAPALRRARGRLQIVFQDPYGSLNPRLAIGAMLEEPLVLHEVVPAPQRRRRVDELLALVGLRPGDVRRYPHEFSGGQRQRLAIARALASAPRVIVCDEPVSALDVSIQAQILNLLADLQHRLGVAYVFISHDLSVVRQIATRVAVMYLGRFVEAGSADEVFARPRHPYTRTLIAAVPVPVPGARARSGIVADDVPNPLAPPSGCHFHPRCPHAIERCRLEVPELETTSPGGSVACHRWRELDAVSSSRPRRATNNPALARLQAAFVGRRS